MNLPEPLSETNCSYPLIQEFDVKGKFKCEFTYVDFLGLEACDSISFTLFLIGIAICGLTAWSIAMIQAESSSNSVYKAEDPSYRILKLLLIFTISNMIVTIGK
jgi:hypothetical protein